MPGDIWGFVMVKAPPSPKSPNGRRMLLNLDMTLAIIENDEGMAEAVSLAGIRQPTGDPFETFQNDLFGPQK